MPLLFSACPGSRPIPQALLLLALILVGSGCVKRLRDASLLTKSNASPTASPRTIRPEANDQQPLSPRTNSEEAAQRTNINTASAVELEKLPGIGKGLAERIIDHRERFGPFRRTEHLIIVRGISDRRFRALRDLVTVKD